MSEKKSLSKEEYLQSMVAQLEGGKARLETIGKQIRFLESSMSELQATELALNSIESARKGTEILVPLGGDSYVKAALADTKAVLVGVGARISVETPIGEAKKTLEHRRGELDTAMKKLQDSYVDLASKLSELNASVENLVQEIQGK